ncbi:MAG: FAD-dependent oxidoreductase [Syntrophobacteria bacterium]
MSKRKPSHKEAVGAVLVVGAGIGGMQAALDLAASGFKTYLVESYPAAGGKMAQLDKTFPTNDCSMCILSPKMGDLSRHPNIEILTQTQVVQVSGQPGNFTVILRQEPRYVDVEKCTACGTCADKCPRKVADLFNQNLSRRKAAYIPYPQAVPLKYVIDEEHCIYFKKGTCRRCEKFCPSEAIDFTQQPRVLELKVGALILAPGFQPFDPSGAHDAYGYGKCPNVITTLEFERILSATGPYQGELLRPSDRQPPERIAFIQCVGSRDMLCGRGYCSAVCCMAAIKEAVVAHEHQPQGLETTIFFMDIRAYGKGYDEYAEKARERYGLTFVPAKVARVEELPDASLRLHCMDEHGTYQYYEFDLVVLSIGMGVRPEARRLGAGLGLEHNAFGFCQTSLTAPTATNRQGIFVCGAFAGPRDISETVTSAGSAACRASQLLAPKRHTLTREKTFPPERDVASDSTRVGVFVCRCGFNIAQTVDVPEVVSYAQNLPGVVHAEENLFTCSTESCGKIVAAIQEHNLNRVVVASCTPLTHGPLFQETLREAGLNGAYLEMANIREQCAWAHQDHPAAATLKAKDLVRMAVGRVSAARPLYPQSVAIQPQALVIGGGLAGMRAALAVADQGYRCYVIEKERRLGGMLRQLHFTLEGEDPQRILARTMRAVQRHPLIETYTRSRVQSVDGHVGNFTTTIVQEAQGGERVETLRHGVVLVATGAEEYKPQGEYLYGEDERVLTQSELESLIARNDPKLYERQTVAMVQCVGSRNEVRPYCSRLCCNEAIKNALLLKEKNPAVEIYILHRDIRAYGLREEYYQRARELGIVFIRFEKQRPPLVRTVQGRYGSQLILTVQDPLLGAELNLRPELLVLSPAIVSRPGTATLADILKIPLDGNGFFLEAHMKLRPVDFASEGFFLCGMAHYPKTIDESTTQAEAAALRAVALLAQETVVAGSQVARVDQKRCRSCMVCIRTCPFQVPRMDVSGKSFIESVACHGCGMCVAECPAGAIRMEGCADSQVLGAVEALFGTETRKKTPARSVAAGS